MRADQGRRRLRGLRALARWRAAQGGNVALIASILMPTLILLAAGSVEINQVFADKRRTQDVADSAALMAAGQMGSSPVGADQRAKAYAAAQLADVSQHATVTTSATINSDQSVTVGVDTQRQSFFGNFLPPGGFHTHVAATARGLNNVPLCVLGMSSLLSDAIHITGNSQLQAGQCLVHSNQSLVADPAASVLAQANEANLLATGSISAAASTGAPNIPDPFTALSLSPPTACSGPGTPVTVAAGTTQTLAAGVHSGPINVTGGGALTLGAGDHWFCKTLTVSGNSTLSGADVDMVFEPGATLSLSGTAAMNVAGRQSGALAGFVIAADRTYTGTFTLQSDFITGLTGTVYIPTATLAIQGSKPAGATTPWTVLDAQTLTVNGGVQLIINANYQASNVPVPVGVGNNRATRNTQLSQ